MTNCTIEFSGDIDRDSLPDFIIHSQIYDDNKWSLILSSEATEGFFAKKVAVFQEIAY